MSVNRLKPWRQRVCFIQLEWSIRYTIHEVVDVVVFSVYTSRIHSIGVCIHLENTNYWCGAEFECEYGWYRMRMTQIGYQSKGVQKLNTDLAPVNKILCPQILIQKVESEYAFLIITRTTVHEQSVSRSRTAHERVSVWDSTRGRTAHARGLCDIGEPE